MGLTGWTGLSEGDLPYDATMNTLFGMVALGPGGTNHNLFTLNQSTGVATIVGNIENADGSPSPGVWGIDYSAMAFDAAGNLWVIDTANGTLSLVNKNTATIIHTIDLSISFPGGLAPNTAGLAIDAATGIGYYVTGYGSAVELIYFDPFHRTVNNGGSASRHHRRAVGTSLYGG